MKPRKLPIIIVTTSALASWAFADTLTQNPDLDNTLIQTASGTLSNALGDLYVGRTGQADASSRRRGAIRFDVAGGVPAGSTINSVTLRLWLVAAGDATVRTVYVHPASASWGEGSSYYNGGVGAASTTNDATWIHRFYSGTSWTSAGGDHGAASGSAGAGSSGATGQWYTWSSAGMASDVQGWLDTPSSNRGWILIGDESTGGTARRFTSREATDDAGDHFPELVIDYTPPPGLAARPGAAATAAIARLGTSATAALAGAAEVAGLRLLGARDLDGDGAPDLLLRARGGALLGGHATPSGLRTWALALDRAAADPLAAPPPPAAAAALASP